MDPYNFKVRLQKAVDKDRSLNNINYSLDYADGVNRVLDLITEITGMRFRHVDDYIWPMG